MTLKSLLKSLLFFVVNVFGISSTNVKLCSPENNSLNLSKTIALTFGESFDINDF